MTNTDTTTATEPARFEVGTTVDTGRGDYSWTFTVVARSAAFVTLREWGTGDDYRVKVQTDGAADGGEWALPFGRYSMAPVVRAAR